MVRFYLMPIEEVVVNPIAGTIQRRPAFDLTGIEWDWVDYGVRPSCFVAADVTPEQHAAIDAEPAMTVFPDTIDVGVGGAASTLQAELENHALPGSWIVGGTTYRSVMRVVVGVMRLAQRYAGMARAAGADPNLFPAGIDLNTQYRNMPVDYRERVLAAANELGFNVPTPQPNSTMRDLLQLIGSQQVQKTFLGVTV